jgi:hypothetical protein
MVVGKFVVDSNVVIYGCTVALVSASVWNVWPTKLKTSVPSAPTGTLLQIGSINKE